MRLLVTGSQGQLGRALVGLALERGHHVSGHDIDTLDITDPEAVDSAVQIATPDCVVNCAAYTAVDDCEANEPEALNVNAGAVSNLATACRSSDASLVHISTDYVFSGEADRPYREDDPVLPTTAYGRTKLQGEREAAQIERHLIVRTAWLYGLGGRNFVEAIRNQVNSGNRELRVVADQVGCPTFCNDLASAILELISQSATGVVHATNSGTVSWHGFAEEIVRLLGSSAAVLPVSSEEYPRPAKRPKNSSLDTSRLAGLLGGPLPSWQQALERYLEST